MFEIIPAIDLLDGQVVRLHKGDYSQKKVYSDDPVAFARGFIDAGAKWIHIVDLNAARSGDRSVNGPVLTSIASAIHGRASIQTGGGIRDREAIEASLALGVSRVIIGTKAATSPDDIGRFLSEFGAEQILVGADVSDGRIKIQGWEKDGGYEMFDFFRMIEDLGVKQIVLTNIASDGTLEGVSLPFYERAVSSCGLNIIISGGVAGFDDVSRVADWNHPRITGMIVGKAYYEGRIDLTLAIQRAGVL